MTAGPGGSPGRPGTVALVWRETGYQQLMFWRNSFGAAFTVVFSSVFLVLLSLTNAGHVTYLHDISLAQYYTPGFMAYGVMAACFNNLAISTVIRRETGLLKRQRLSPLPSRVLIVATVLSATLVSIVGAVLLAVIGVAGFDVRIAPAALLPLAVAIALGAAAFSALGLAVSTIVPNEEAAGPTVSIMFFLLLFLSGLWFPLKPGSTLARISGVFPVRRMILTTTQPFIGHSVSPWDGTDLLIVAVWGLAAAVLATRRFRWSPWKDDHAGARPRRGRRSLMRR